MSLLAIMETDVHAIRIRSAQGFAATRPWGARAWERAWVWGDQVRTPCSELTQGVWGIIWSAHSLGLKPAWNIAKGRLWSEGAACPASVESGPCRTYLCPSPPPPSLPWCGRSFHSNSQGPSLFWPMACRGKSACRWSKTGSDQPWPYFSDSDDLPSMASGWKGMVVAPGTPNNISKSYVIRERGELYVETEDAWSPEFIRGMNGVPPILPRHWERSHKRDFTDPIS